MAIINFSRWVTQTEIENAQAMGVDEELKWIWDDLFANLDREIRARTHRRVMVEDTRHGAYFRVESPVFEQDFFNDLRVLVEAVEQGPLFRPDEHDEERLVEALKSVKQHLALQ